MTTAKEMNVINGVSDILRRKRYGDMELLTTSRKVAEVFGKKHNHTIDAIENLLQMLENGGSRLNITPNSMFMETKYTTPNANGVYYKEYIMNRDGFTLLAMGFTGKKALQFKLAYIELFNRMEEELKKRKMVPSYQIEDPITRAEVWVEEQKQARAELEAKEEQLAIQAPKAKVYDNLLATGKNIDVKEFALLAKLRDENGNRIGRNNMYKLLRSMGLIQNSPGKTTMPFQHAIRSGWFDTVLVTHLDYGGTRNSTKTLITPKGIDYLIKRFTDMGYYEN